MLREDFGNTFQEEVSRIQDETELKEHQAFYEELSGRMEIFDPLDREFLDGEGTKMNITREELLERLFG